MSCGGDGSDTDNVGSVVPILHNCPCSVPFRRLLLPVTGIKSNDLVVSWISGIMQLGQLLPLWPLSFFLPSPPPLLPVVEEEPYTTGTDVPMTVGGEMLPELLLARDESPIVVDCRVIAGAVVFVVIAMVEGMPAAAPSAHAASDDDEGMEISISIPTDPVEKVGAAVIGSLL